MSISLVDQLNALNTRRKSLQAAYDAIISDPASYSIQGSVSATNQKLSEIRTELAEVNRRMSALVTQRSLSFVTPYYRRRPSDCI